MLKHACTLIHTHTHAHTRTNTQTYAHIHTLNVHTHTYTQTATHTQNTSAHMYSDTHNTSSQSHTQTHMHTHSHAHSHAHKCYRTSAHASAAGSKLHGLLGLQKSLKNPHLSPQQLLVSPPKIWLKERDEVEVQGRERKGQEVMEENEKGGKKRKKRNGDYEGRAEKSPYRFRTLPAFALPVDPECSSELHQTLLPLFLPKPG